MRIGNQLVNMSSIMRYVTTIEYSGGKLNLYMSRVGTRKFARGDTLNAFNGDLWWGTGGGEGEKWWRTGEIEGGGELTKVR